MVLRGLFIAQRSCIGFLKERRTLIRSRDHQHERVLKGQKKNQLASELMFCLRATIAHYSEQQSRYSEQQSRYSKTLFWCEFVWVLSNSRRALIVSSYLTRNQHGLFEESTSCLPLSKVTPQSFSKQNIKYNSIRT